MPLLTCPDNAKAIDEAKRKVQKEIEEVILDTGARGIIIKADSLGSLEALIKLFGEKNIKIRKASIGDISKKDMLDAESNYENDPLLSAIIGFNVTVGKGIEVPKKIQIITGDIIYKLMDDYIQWTEEKKKSLEAEQLDLLIRPAKIEVLQNCIFRQSNPAIVGVFVMVGKIKTGTPLMKDGKELTQVKSIQNEQESMTILEQGKQAAVSLPNIVCGRNLFEGNILYSSIPEEHFRQLKKLKKYLNESELQVMREIADLMRKGNPVWGV
jgi:translation initiation factor 5B